MLSFLFWELIFVLLSVFTVRYLFDYFTVHCCCFTLKVLNMCSTWWLYLVYQKKKKSHDDDVSSIFLTADQFWICQYGLWLNEKEQPWWAEQLQATGNAIKVVLVFVLKLVSVLDFKRDPARIRSRINWSNQGISNTSYLHPEEKQLDSVTSEPQKRCCYSGKARTHPLVMPVTRLLFLKKKTNLYV